VALDLDFDVLVRAPCAKLKAGTARETKSNERADLCAIICVIKLN